MRYVHACHYASKSLFPVLSLQFVDMQGWRLERGDQEEVSSVLNPSSNTLVADIQELPTAVQVLHWVAPRSYLGDRVSEGTGRRDSPPGFTKKCRQASEGNVVLLFS